MLFKEIFLKGCFIITPKTYNDTRGVFSETFSTKEFQKNTGKQIIFVQDNQSTSKKNVVRGLHFQTGEHAQAKLVRVVAGSVLDVCVDLRQNSATFGKHFSIVLDDKKRQQLFIPRGFAHGFLALEEKTIVTYKCDNYYYKPAESGIIFSDKELNINWEIATENIIISEKDKNLPTFEALFQ